MTLSAKTLQNLSQNQSKQNNHKKLNEDEIFLATKSSTGKMLRKIDLMAYGVWCEMLDHPQTWSYYLKQNIAENLSIGYTTLKKKISILIDYGLIERQDKRGYHGHFKSIYSTFQFPQDHAKKNLLSDYNKLTIQNVNRDGSQNVAPAIIYYQEENTIKNNLCNAVNNNIISAKSVPKTEQTEQYPDKNISDFEDRNVAASNDNKSVSNVKAVIEKIPANIRDKMSDDDKRQVKEKLFRYQADYDVERLTEITLYALRKHKGMGYFETCLHKNYPEIRQEKHDPNENVDTSMLEERAKRSRQDSIDFGKMDFMQNKEKIMLGKTKKDIFLIKLAKENGWI